MVDAAYSSDDLLYHTDQGFFESPPGLELIHCLKYCHFCPISLVFCCILLLSLSDVAMHFSMWDLFLKIGIL